MHVAVEQENTMSIDNRKLQVIAGFAAQMHRNQVRFPGVPYIVHPMAVMSMVLENASDFGEFTMAAAATALLHDTLEDNPEEASVERILQITEMPIVADAVQALTKNRGVRGKRAQLEDSIQRCLQVGIWVLGVKGLDRVDNYNPATVPPHWQPQWRYDYIEEGRAIMEALQVNGPACIHKALARAEQRYRDACPSSG